ADLEACVVELTLEHVKTAADTVLTRFGRRTSILCVLQRVAQVRDVVHRPLELANDHGHALVRFRLQLVSRARERGGGEVGMGLLIEPGDRRTGRDPKAESERHPATRVADERDDHEWRRTSPALGRPFTSLVARAAFP